jgi:predicted transposase YdaD
VHRIYLDELGDIRSLPLWVAVMVLTTIKEEQAPSEARYLLSRTRQETAAPLSNAIIEIITTIIAYRFEQLSRREVESMLDITLKETRVYREIKEEGREEGREAMANMISRQLTKRLGEIPQDVLSVVRGLQLPMLEELGEALLDFTSVADLQAWLRVVMRKAPKYEVQNLLVLYFICLLSGGYKRTGQIYLTLRILDFGCKDFGFFGLQAPPRRILDFGFEIWDLI